MFLNDYWYVASHDDEITNGIFQRVILGKDLVFFRDKENQPVAFDNRCPHRFVPLTLGQIIDGTLRCGYHGFRFNGSGQCIEVPGQTDIPPRSTVRCYPTVTRYGYIWVWMGDPDKADEEKLPHNTMKEIEDSNASVIRGSSHINAYYELIADNLLDLSHIQFVHKVSFGAQAVSDGEVKTKIEDDTVIVTREVLDQSPSESFKLVTNIHENVDTLYKSVWSPPSSIWLKIGGGISDKKSDTKYFVYVSHMLTPETETSTHYFWSLSRNFNTENIQVSEKHREMIVAAFVEDKVLLEAQQKALGEYGDIRGMNLSWTKGDLGSSRARKILERLSETQ